MAQESFSFLHAADLHLDSPLRGLAAYPGAPVAELRLASREAFAGLVRTAIERDVAFVVLAGDLFDGEWRDYDSGLWFSARLRELDAAEIPVFAIRGNHDAESRVTRRLTWPANVHVFGSDAPSTERLDAIGVAVHGQSYPDATVEANLARDYPDPVPGDFNVGLLHTALDGREGHDRYAPCTVSELAAKGYDYWALGHVHRREVVAADPYIVFPGNLQGRHVRETGPKGATLVHVERGAVARLEELALDVVRWDRIVVDVEGAGDEAEILRRVDDSLGRSTVTADGRTVAARVVLVGATELDAALRVHRERIVAEVRAAAQRVDGDAWVERVVLDTRPPEEREAAADIAGLARRIEGATLDDEALARMAAELGTLADRLPSSARETVDPRDVDALRGLTEAARLDLAAMLASAREPEDEP
ncbi:MAG: metallophosphoesterase [Planctomycetota bacterium]